MEGSEPGVRLFRRVAFVLAFPLAAAAIIPVAAQASVQAGAAGRAGPAARLTWGRAEEVPGTAVLPGGAPLFENETTSISCVSAGNCEAAGHYSAGGRCSAGGFYGADTHRHAFVISRS